jgi:hypothetical protein
LEICGSATLKAASEEEMRDCMHLFYDLFTYFVIDSVLNAASEEDMRIWVHMIEDTVGE